MTSFVVTNAHGDAQTFSYWSNKYSLEGDYECGFAQGFRLSKWTFPQGPEIDLTYGNKYDYQKFGSGTDGFEQLVSVRNSVGREIDFAANGYIVTGFSNALAGLDARSVSLGDYTGYGTDGLAGSVTDPLQAKTSYAFLPAQVRSDTQRPVPHAQLFQIYTPDKPAKPNLQYNYDSEGRVKEVVDAENLQVGDRAPWSFFLADGTRGERDDWRAWRAWKLRRRNICQKSSCRRPDLMRPQASIAGRSRWAPNSFPPPTWRPTAPARHCSLA